MSIKDGSGEVKMLEPVVRFREGGERVRMSLQDIDKIITLLTLGNDYIPEGDISVSGLLGHLFNIRAGFTKNPEDVEQAILKYRRALHFTSDGNPDALELTIGLIYALESRFKLLHDLQDIDEALQLHRKCVLDSNPNAKELHRLSMLLYQRFLEASNEDNIREAVAALKEALEITNSSDNAYSVYAVELGGLMLKLANFTKNVQDIDDTLNFLETTSKLIADETFFLSMTYRTNAWILRFESTKDVEDLNRAITNQRELVKLSNDAIHLQSLGELLLIKYGMAKNIEDVEEALDVLHSAFEVTSSNISELLQNLLEIESLYAMHFEASVNTNVMNIRMTLLEEALRRCPRDNERLSDILYRIGFTLQQRFCVGGDKDDLKDAISTAEEALERTPSDHPKFCLRLSTAGRMILVRFENTGDPNDLDQSIYMLQEALEKAPKDEPLTAPCLGHLGSALLNLFILKGDMDALDDSVSLHRHAVELSKTQSDHHEYLTGLGDCLQQRYTSIGNFADIDEAVTLQQEAVKATSNRDFPLRIHLLNLGNAYAERFLARESVEDLKEAVAVFRKARHLVRNESGMMKPTVLDNLSAALDHLAIMIRKPELLEEAMEILTESMSLTEENHPYKLNQLGMLATLHRNRYMLFQGNLEDLEISINILNYLLEHPARTDFIEMKSYQNIICTFAAKYFRTANIEDLNIMITYMERSLDKESETDIMHSTLLAFLAHALTERFYHLNDVTDLYKAAQFFRQAAVNLSGHNSHRLDAAVCWARTLLRLHEPDFLIGYGLAIELLFSSIAWIGETVAERHNKLRPWSFTISEAAAAAISFNEFDLALQWLEAGRSIVWSQLNTFRTPVDNLHEVRPDLADELRYISKELDRLGTRSMKEADRMTFDQKFNFQAEARIQRDLTARWKEILTDVRAITGFEDFLRPADVSKILNMKRPKGIVVIINVGKVCSDALALCHDSQDLVHIPLDKFGYEEAETFGKRLASARKKYARERAGRVAMPNTSSSVEDILIKLWIGIVRPIVTALGLKPSRNPPRIWWCATGPLAFLPIHAAGIYTGKDACFGTVTSDYVVSSYTPTISAVFSTPQEGSARTLKNMLIVTQPNTPFLKPIPDTAKEGRTIEKLMQSHNIMTKYLEGREANVGNVVKNMETSNWIHFACHAMQDLKNPSGSAFYLDDGKLELGVLMRKQLPKADFAFLSACQTASGDEELSEESAHLAAGVLQAGFKSVIATMWSIDDSYAPMVADGVYKRLFENSNPPNSAYAAYALQESVRELREKLGNSEVSFLTWVPFVHFGV